MLSSDRDRSFFPAGFAPYITGAPDRRNPLRSAASELSGADSSRKSFRSLLTENSILSHRLASDTVPILCQSAYRFLLLLTEALAYFVLKRRGKPQDFGAWKISQKSIKKALTSSKAGAILRLTRAKLGWIDHVGKVFFVIEKR